MKWANWTPRGVSLIVAVLLHAAFLTGFLSKFRVGVPVSPSANARLSEAPVPITASILSFDKRNFGKSNVGIEPLDAQALSSTAPLVEVPVTPPSWSSEDEAVLETSRPAAVSGSTSLHCEVHIHQSPQGRVRAIDFGECTGDFIWQHTLLQAIERAAQHIEPLPDVEFPPVRTLTVGTNNLSETLLARQLSSVEVPERRIDVKVNIVSPAE